MLMSVQTGVPCKWTSDSKLFILDNFDTIQDSPSEVYNSALTLCPPSSWLHGYHTVGVRVAVGSAGWGSCICTVSCHSYLYVLACWNNTIVAGHWDGSITSLDALTGSQTDFLSGHTNYVQSLLSHQMVHYLHLGAMIKPSNFGMSRLVELLQPSMATLARSILCPFQQTIP